MCKVKKRILAYVLSLSKEINTLLSTKDDVRRYFRDGEVGGYFLYPYKLFSKIARAPTMSA